MQDLSLCSASLLPKLRDQYAEFLDHVSLVHLRLLASPTCVGFRYGHHAAPRRAFLACRLHDAWHWVAPLPRRPLSPTLPRSTGLAAGPNARLRLVQVPLLLHPRQTGPEFQPAFHRLRLWGLAL